MGTDLAVAVPDELADSMRWAEVLAGSSLVPPEYRRNPANIVLAHTLGRAMGLDVAQALLRINVIMGRPAASGELILSNVRRSGHRVRFIPGPGECTCVIIRADDPEWEHRATFTMAMAERLGYVRKDSWKQQPDIMLQWRALSACARMACPESLFGVVYTTDEAEDIKREWDDTRVMQNPATAVPTGQPQEPPAHLSAEVFRQAREVARPEDPPPPSSDEATPDAPPSTVVVPDPPAPPTKPKRARREPRISDDTHRRMFALLHRKGIPESRQLAGINRELGLTGTDQELQHRRDMTEEQALTIIATLEPLPDRDVVDGDIEQVEELPFGEPADEPSTP